MTAARLFLANIIDYAGLFPPAGLDMAMAVGNYAGYLKSDDRDLLGRFVLPSTRLEEFSECAAMAMSRDGRSHPWRLSIIANEDPALVRKKALEFNCSHWEGSATGHAVCDSIELPVGEPSEVDAAAANFPDFFKLFLEVPAADNREAVIERIARCGANAKIRTGGVTPSSFPGAADVVRFIASCHGNKVKFKATGGLHHPIRASYPLTYQEESARAPMFGYLNVFLAAAFLHGGHAADTAAAVLEESDPGTFVFGDSGLTWRGRLLTLTDLRAAREELAVSFGSCSFTEPVNEARALGFL